MEEEDSAPAPELYGLLEDPTMPRKGYVLPTPLLVLTVAAMLVGAVFPPFGVTHAVCLLVATLSQGRKSWSAIRMVYTASVVLHIAQLIVEFIVFLIKMEECGPHSGVHCGSLWLLYPPHLLFVALSTVYVYNVSVDIDD